jgi:hypothetical protein
MGASPKWKVYTEDNEYIASVKHPIYGAMLLGAIGKGTLRLGHKAIKWTEGVDGNSAESYDHTAFVAMTQ